MAMEYDGHRESEMTKGFGLNKRKNMDLPCTDRSDSEKRRFMKD